jgi:hypothetical protein
VIQALDQAGSFSPELTEQLNLGCIDLLNRELIEYPGLMQEFAA